MNDSVLMPFDCVKLASVKSCVGSGEGVVRLFREYFWAPAAFVPITTLLPIIPPGEGPNARYAEPGYEIVNAIALLPVSVYSTVTPAPSDSVAAAVLSIQKVVTTYEQKCRR